MTFRLPGFPPSPWSGCCSHPRWPCPSCREMSRDVPSGSSFRTFQLGTLPCTHPGHLSSIALPFPRGRLPVPGVAWWQGSSSRIFPGFLLILLLHSTGSFAGFWKLTSEAPERHHSTLTLIPTLHLCSAGHPHPSPLLSTLIPTLHLCSARHSLLQFRFIAISFIPVFFLAVSLPLPLAGPGAQLLEPGVLGSVRIFLSLALPSVGCLSRLTAYPGPLATLFLSISSHMGGALGGLACACITGTSRPCTGSLCHQ